MDQLNIITAYSNVSEQERKLALWNLRRLAHNLPFDTTLCADASRSGHYMSIFGGFSAINNITAIPEEKLRSQIKSMCGYSDFTSILLWLTKLGVPAIHGPMFMPDFSESHGVDPVTLKSYMKAIRAIESAEDFTDTWQTLPFFEFVDWWTTKRWTETRRPMTPSPMRFWGTSSAKRFEGFALAGNLTIFERQLGTKYFPERLLDRDNILFFEDCLMDPYDLANIFGFLKLKNVFRNTRLILLGHVELDSQVSKDTMNEVYQSLHDMTGLPIVSGCPFGHRQPQKSIIQGRKTVIVRTIDSLGIVQTVDRGA
jgi:muramoyltetrapeptide carboxypeptidase LdcA involved in peptidoglycan recycling